MNLKIAVLEDKENDYLGVSSENLEWWRKPNRIILVSDRK